MDVVQVDIEFGTSQGGVLQFNWASLQKFLDSIDPSELNWFFFQRKPPGLRVRFSFSSKSFSHIRDLILWLEYCKSRDWVRCFRFRRYEPEEFKFGGELGLLLTHELFFRDSQVALGLMEIDSSLSDPDFLRLASVQHVDSLLLRACEDLSEIEEVWGLVAKEVSKAPGQIGVNEIERFDVWSVRRHREIGKTASALFEVSASIGEDFSLFRRVNFDVSFSRTWLCNFVIYHFNRLGFDPSDIGILISLRRSIGFRYDLL